ncbi:hypothetical protein [Desulfosoma caldarium]|uniref:Uncharacterized protein n=1 Tax=Desulfosoma caldarium TaxID=610254 RepID=A0A3N1VFI2_9BACT|nr:hypothetical protein [Desulfosoma caldarium]ROR01645.1 hypothetical protein EDC27_0824 [Desulfosoma caldarium]
MAINALVAVGTERGVDTFDRVLGFLEKSSPSRMALDENPIAFSTLVHMRTAPELHSEAFLRDQKKQILRRGGDVGVLAGLAYAVHRRNLPVHFADGALGDILSSTGELIGSYPYVGDLNFAVNTDMMRTPMELIKQRIPRYPGHDFDYELIHAYQVEASDALMDRAIPMRNRFTAMVIDAIMETYKGSLLVFIGQRKRFRKELFEATEGLGQDEVENFVPLLDLIHAKNKSFVDLTET